MSEQQTSPTVSAPRPPATPPVAPRRDGVSIAIGVALGVAVLVGVFLVMRGTRSRAPAPAAPPLAAPAPPLAPLESPIIARGTVVDPCASLPDGRHTMVHQGEVVAQRTCEGGNSVTFCDVELTRTANRIALEVCQARGTRSMTITGDLDAGGGSEFRIGGRVRGVDYGALDVGGTLTVAAGSRIVAYLSGPFEPAPSDRFEVFRAARTVGALGVERVELPGGGSFKLELSPTALVLTDYRPAAFGFHYAPVRVMPSEANGGGRIGGSLKIEGSVTTRPAPPPPPPPEPR